MPGVAEQLAGGATLATLQPLKIQSLADSSAAQITSYKPTYELKTAEHALDTAGVFEGQISLVAVDPQPVDLDLEKTITGTSALTWKVLSDTMTSFAYVEMCNTSFEGSTMQVKRTMFPVILASALEDKEALKMERKPLLFGHQYVYAWYLSMFKQFPGRSRQ